MRLIRLGQELSLTFNLLKFAILHRKERTSLLGKRSRNFSTAQIALLTYYFENGMRGIGRKYSGIINRASIEAKLSTDQVKVILQA